MQSILSSTPDRPAVPQWLVGLWQRQAIELPDGAVDRTTRVFWGQTHSLYVDIRVPVDRPSGQGRESFADFSLEELYRLADQKGFAGHIAVDGTLCRWTRYIDYRPSNGRPDEGYLRLDGDTLYEEGDPSSVLGTSYRETYRRLCRAERRSVALRRTFVSEKDRKLAHERDGVLVIVDDHFLYTRARSIELPRAETLRDLVIAAGTDRALIHAYLDGEISYGRIDAGSPWKVELSTIPFRENRRLGDIGSARAGTDTESIELDGREGIETWRVVESSLSQADLIALLNK